MPVPGRAILAAVSTALMVSSAVLAQAQEERVSSGSRNCHEQLSDVSLDLYELCVAYCYADCSLSDLDTNCRPGDPEILEKYNNLMRPGDPPMPCVRSGCPCFSAEDLRETFVSRPSRPEGPQEARLFEYPYCAVVDEVLWLRSLGTRQDFATTTQVAPGEDRPSTCVLYDRWTLSIQAVSENEWVVCNDFLKDRVAELQLTCHVPVANACWTPMRIGQSGLCFTNELDVPVRIDVLDTERGTRVIRHLRPLPDGALPGEAYSASSFVYIQQRRASWRATTEEQLLLCSGEIVFEARPSGRQTVDQIRIAPETGCKLEP